MLPAHGNTEDTCHAFASTIPRAHGFSIARMKHKKRIEESSSSQHPRSFHWQVRNGFVQAVHDRRRVHPGLWRWLAVAEGLWGQAMATMIIPESQEKPLQDKLRQDARRELFKIVRSECSTTERGSLDWLRFYYKMH